MGYLGGRLLGHGILEGCSHDPGTTFKFKNTGRCLLWLLLMVLDICLHAHWESEFALIPWGVLLQILDRGVPWRFLNPNPI